MIKYHVTPIGGNNNDVVRFLQGGRHALVSMHRPDQLSVVMECCESFIIDNGAFSLWMSGGGNVNLDDYFNFVSANEKHSNFDYYFVPDIIGGGFEQNKTMYNDWFSIKRDKRNAVPVFHLDEPVDWFMELSENHDKVALGSTDKWPKMGSRGWWDNMVSLMNLICDKDGYPPCKLHGLRMLDPEIFKYLPLHSADSSNAAINGSRLQKVRQYPVPERWQGSEIIAHRIDAHQSAKFWDYEVVKNANKTS